MKKALALILAAFMCIALVACATPAGGGEVEEGPIVLRFMAYNSEGSRQQFMDYLNAHLDGIEIQYEFVSLDDFNNVLATQLQAGEGPDIIEGGGNTKTLAAADYLYDLAGEGFVSQYAMGGIGAYMTGDQVWGIPLNSWFEGIWYNKDIFAEAGVSVPRSLDEFIQLHKDLKAAGFKAQTMGASSWEPMMKQSIGVVNNEFYSNPANKDFDKKFNSGDAKLADAWLPAVEAWSKVIDEGCLTKDMLGMGYDQAQEEFALGKAAMWESGPWAVEAINSISGGDLNFGMFPIPGVNEGPGWLVGGAGSSLCINKNSKNIDAVLEVFALASTADAQKALLATNPGTSSFLIGVDADLGDLYADCAECFKAGNVNAPWTYAWDFGDPVVQPYGEALQAVLDGKMTVLEALEIADKANADQHGW